MAAVEAKEATRLVLSPKEQREIEVLSSFSFVVLPWMG